jgi:hypothetical protein
MLLQLLARTFPYRYSGLHEPSSLSRLCMDDGGPTAAPSRARYAHDSTPGREQHSGHAAISSACSWACLEAGFLDRRRMCAATHWLKRNAVARFLHEALLPTLFLPPSHPCNLSSKSWHTIISNFGSVPGAPIGSRRIFNPCGARRLHAYRAHNTLPTSKFLSAASTTHLAYRCSDSSSGVCSTTRISAIGPVSPRYRDSLS